MAEVAIDRTVNINSNTDAQRSLMVGQAHSTHATATFFNKAGLQHMILRVDGIDGTASDTVVTGVPGLRKALWDPDAAVDTCVTSITDQATGEVTFVDAANSDCDGYLHLWFHG